MLPGVVERDLTAVRADYAELGPPDTVRVVTGGRTVTHIARDVVAATGRVS